MHVNYSDSNNVNKLIFNEIEPRNRYGYIRIDAKSENWKQDIDKKQKEILKQGVFSKNIILEVCSINHGYNELPLFKGLISKIEKKNTESILVMNSMNEYSYSLTNFLWLNHQLFQKNIYIVTLDLNYCESSIINKKILENFAKIYQIHMIDNLLNSEKVSKEKNAEDYFYLIKTRIKRTFNPRIRTVIPLILELKTRGFSVRDISNRVKISRTTVYKVLNFLESDPYFLEYNKNFKNQTSEKSNQESINYRYKF